MTFLLRMLPTFPRSVIYFWPTMARMCWGIKCHFAWWEINVTHTASYSNEPRAAHRPAFWVSGVGRWLHILFIFSLFLLQYWFFPGNVSTVSHLCIFLCTALCCSVSSLSPAVDKCFSLCFLYLFLTLSLSPLFTFLPFFLCCLAWIAFRSLMG